MLTCLSCLVLPVIVIALQGQIAESREFKLGLLIPYSKCTKVHTFPYYCGNNYASAISVAVDKINSDPNLLAGHNLTFVWADTLCEELIAVKKQIEQMRAGVDAFIGPGCKCETAATNAAAYNLSIISYVSKILYFYKPNLCSVRIDCKAAAAGMSYLRTKV